MTGDARLAEEPAQARTQAKPATPPEAPEPTNKIAAQDDVADNETTNLAIGTEGAEAEVSASVPAAGDAISLADRMMAAAAAQVAAGTRAGGDRVTVRPKPEKRKNYKERAKAKFGKATFAKDDAEETAKDGTTPATTATAKSEASSETRSSARSEAKATEKAAARMKAKLRAKAERQKAKAGRGKVQKSKSAA